VFDEQNAAGAWRSVVTADRWEHIAASFSRINPDQPLGDRLCTLACTILNMARSSVGLLSGNHFVPVAATDDRARTLVDQQFTLGDGPAFEAVHTVTPVLAPDLTSPVAGSRWPAFAPVATALGVKAEFAFPLRVGAARLGVLTLYDDNPTTLGPATVADAMVLASFAAEVIIGMQAGDEQHPGTLLPNLNSGSEVHQAVGMVSEQLGIPIVEALVRLRSHAYASNTPLSVIARNVINGQLTLDP